jgi:hypothetical protein
MKRTLKAGRCLLVLALLAGPAIERSFAGDAAPGAKRAPLGQVKTKFGSPSAGMPQPQRPSTAQTRGRVVRNAIGLPVGHAEGLVRGDGVRHEGPGPSARVLEAEFALAALVGDYNDTDMASEQHFVGERLLDVLPDHPRHRPGAHQLVVGGNVMS